MDSHNIFVLFCFVVFFIFYKKLAFLVILERINLKKNFSKFLDLFVHFCASRVMEFFYCFLLL